MTTVGGGGGEGREGGGRGREGGEGGGSGGPAGASPLVVDRALVERINRAEVAGGHSLAAAAAAFDPTCGAGALAVGSGLAVSTGVGSYVNRAWGLGLDGPVTDEHVDALVAFYAERGLPAALELTPWTHPSGLALVQGRGWRTAWFLTTSARRLADTPRPATPAAAARAADPDLEVTSVTEAEREEWIETVVEGNAPGDEDERRRSRHFAELAWRQPDETAFLARRAGRAVGCASLAMAGGVARLGGAATRVAYRQRGVQSALLAARLAVAAEAGCDLAVVSADPLGPSARNIQRAGFSTVWTILLATAT